MLCRGVLQTPTSIKLYLFLHLSPSPPCPLCLTLSKTPAILRVFLQFSKIIPAILPKTIINLKIPVIDLETR